MLFFIGWLGLSLVIGYMGKNRSIEFTGAFAVSLLLSPIVGLLVVLLSAKGADQAIETLEYGEQLLQKGSFSKALEVFEKMLSKRPDTITVHYNLARTYSLMNRPEESLHHLNRAFEYGYFNLYKVQTSDDLQNLRDYEGYKTFEPNRYMLGYFLNSSKDQLALKTS